MLQLAITCEISDSRKLAISLMFVLPEAVPVISMESCGPNCEAPCCKSCESCKASSLGKACPVQ